MKKNGLKFAVLLASLFVQNTASAVAPTSQGRLVVFADKKSGDFKTDKSIKIGTSETIENLKLLESDKNVHACFVGSAAAIRPIVDTMISNSEKDLKLETFKTEGAQSSIFIDITSEESKSSYLRLKIDPC
jgi:hypothetical protein